MPLFPSDFKQFKHVKSDEHTTTLQHPKGHQITIVHKALTKPMQEQLKALAKGGEVKGEKKVEKVMHEYKHGELSSSSGDKVTNPKQAVAIAMSEAGMSNKKADGGMISCYQDGGTVHDATKAGYLGTIPQVTQEIEEGDNKYKGMQDYHGDTSVDVRTPEQKAKAEELSKQNSYAEGGDVQLEPAQSAEQQSQQAQLDPDLLRKRILYNNVVGTMEPESPAMIPQNMVFGPKGEEPKDFSPKLWGQAEQMFQREKANNAADATAAQQQAIQINTSRAAAGLQPLPVPDVPNGPQIPGSQAPQPNPMAQQAVEKAQQQVQQPQNPMATGAMDAEGMMRSGYQNEMAGINQQATAQGNMAQEQLQSLQHMEQSKLDAQAGYQQHYDDLEQERQHLMADVQNGHINPEKFWDNHSKIATGIGIILAGFNPTNHPNAAIDFLNKQMEMNIDAQKSNLAARQNLLSANLRQFGNLKDAMDMTRVMQADIIGNELQQAAAKATTPLAKAAALQAAGKLQQQYAPVFQQFAMRRAMIGLANGSNPDAASQMLGYLRVSNPEMAKEMESRLVPGVGMASIPIPEKVREQFSQYQQADTAIKDLQKFVNTHSTIVPGTPEYNVGQQKALALQALVRESKLGTVYREGEQPLLDKFVNSNPAGALKMLKTQPQLHELLSSNMRNYNVLKQQYGLPASQPEPQIKTVNGVQYVRGPNGEAIRYKGK